MENLTINVKFGDKMNDNLCNLSIKVKKTKNYNTIVIYNNDVIKPYKVSNEMDFKTYKSSNLSVQNSRNAKISNINVSNWYSYKQKKSFFAVLMLRKIIPLTAILILNFQYEIQNIMNWDSYEVTVGSHNFVKTAIMIILTIVFLAIGVTNDLKKYNNL